jgi:hypothetical protein
VASRDVVFGLRMYEDYIVSVKALMQERTMSNGTDTMYCHQSPLRQSKVPSVRRLHFYHGKAIVISSINEVYLHNHDMLAYCR